MTEDKNTRTPEEAQEPAEANAEAAAEGAAPEAETPQEETPETLADTEMVAETEVAEDLGTSAAKGPALDQDEGQIQTDTERNRRKERIGLVVSDKADKTVTVAVETLVRHKRYKKRVRSTKKFMAHDEAN
jgi:small subunit ribosomal protein S17